MISEKDYIIGIDIGGTNFRIGRVTRDKSLKDFLIISSVILDIDSKPLGALQHYIEGYIKKFGDGKLLAISIGFPSAISKDKKTVYSSPNIRVLDNLNVVEFLEDIFKVPIFVDNDVNNLLMYEILKGDIEENLSVLGFYIGTGFGNAIYINNGIFEGKNGVAGELGHIPVIGKFDACGCGNKGCMELYASGKRLVEINKLYFPNTRIDRVFAEHKNHEKIKELIEAISIAICIEINIFDPDYIIVGGGVVNMDGFPKEEFEEEIYKHSRKPYPAETLDIRYADNYKGNGVLGAAYYGYEKLKKY